FFSSRRRHTRSKRDWSSDVCSSDLIADAAMGYAYAATLAEGETFTTIELKINFLRAVRKATLTAEARVVKAGSTVGYVECEVKEDRKSVVAKAASTCMKLRQDRKEAAEFRW